MMTTAIDNHFLDSRCVHSFHNYMEIIMLYLCAINLLIEFVGRCTHEHGKNLNDNQCIGTNVER